MKGGDGVGNVVVSPDLLVVKAGGSVLDSDRGYRKVASMVARLLREGKKVVLVVSAMKGVTDTLLSAYEKADPSFIGKVVESYEEVRSRLGLHDSSFGIGVDALLRDLVNTFNAFLILKLRDGRVRDLILSFGEKVSAYIMAGALENEGVGSIPLYGRGAGIVTDQRFSEASPLPSACEHVRERLGRVLSKGVTPVVAGFIGETPEGLTTTMGRGGSDFTATFISKCLGAVEARLITDVPGIMTGDPRIFRDARTIPVLSYDEAIELAHLGGKKFHPRTFEPVRETPIVTRVLELGSERGTAIVKSWRQPPLKAVAVVRDLELVMVRGAGMVGRRGTAARVMQVASEAGVNIIAISQPVSETSINLVVKKGSGKLLEKGLQRIVEEQVIREYEVINDAEAVSLIGCGLRRPEIIGETLGMLKGHSIYMLAKGPMEVSLSVVAPSSEAEEIAREFHSIVLENTKSQNAEGMI